MNTLEPCEKCLPIIRYHKAERDAVLFALKMAEEERDALRAELEAYRRGGGEIARLTILLRLASGALVDAGTVQTDDVDAGIRALTAERDAMQSKRDALADAVKCISAERDALLAALETIAAQSSGISGSTNRADCMAALARVALSNSKRKGGA